MEEKNPIQVADRLFHVLELLADQGPMQLMDIAAEEELNKTTAFRVLRSLMHLGYVRQDPSDGRYSLTFRIVGLADKVREQTDMIGFLHPYLEELSGQIRETIHLVMLEESFSPDTDTEATYVDKVESPYNAVRMVSEGHGTEFVLQGHMADLFSHKPCDMDSLVLQKPFRKGKLLAGVMVARDHKYLNPSLVKAGQK